MNDVVIIGAGVLGVSLAYHLSNAGISSIILEKENTAATHASGKNAGMMRQLYHHPQLTQWAMRSISEMPNRLKEKHFTQTGSLIVGRTVPSHHKELFTQDSRGVRCKSDGLLDSAPYVQELLALAKKNKVVCNLNHEVISLNKINSLWQITCADGQVINAKLLVNATGAWTNRILPLSTINAKAYARHLAVVEGFSDDFMPAEECGFYWDENESWYMRRWSKSSRLVSICDQVPCEPEIFPNTLNIHEEVARTLFKHMPLLAKNLSIGSYWHCYRTYTEDRLPVIGHDPEDPSFFWLAGFGGFGMSTSYAATQDAARLIIGDTVPGLENFSPSRCKQYAQINN